MVPTVKNATLWTCTVFSCLCLLLLATWSIGPELEERMFPLFTEVKAAIIKTDSIQSEAIITGIKTRNCSLRAAHVMVHTTSGWVTGDVLMKTEAGNFFIPSEHHIAEGSPFVRELRILPPGDMAQLTLESVCHPLWVSHQHMLISKTK